MGTSHRHTATHGNPWDSSHVWMVCKVIYGGYCRNEDLRTTICNNEEVNRLGIIHLYSQSVKTSNCWQSQEIRISLMVVRQRTMKIKQSLWGSGLICSTQPSNPTLLLWESVLRGKQYISVTEQDPIRPSPDRTHPPQPSILCFSSSLKYLDNSILCIFSEFFQMLKTATKWKKLTTWWSCAWSHQTFWCLRTDKVNCPVISTSTRELCTSWSHTQGHPSFTWPSRMLCWNP